MKAIGIDLGTTNTVAAIDEGSGPRVLLTRMGESLTPSVVSCRKGTMLVGRLAWNNAVAAPDDTIFSIKRLMGRSLDDANVSKVRERYPYTVVPSDDPDDRGVRVTINGVKYTPEDISAMILRQVVQDANLALGDQVTHTVITVPAYFSEIQRSASRKAAEQAGLIIKKIVDEPTAAAIAFGMDRAGEEHTVLVFDMGGAKLDISILSVADQWFYVLAITGDMWLGGDDFDHEIVGMIAAWVKQAYGVNPLDDDKFLMMARREAEKAKCLLTEQEEVDIIIPACFSLPDGQLGDVMMTITRPEFEALIQDYVDKSIELVHGVLAEQDLEPGDISTVLLAGGATYVPLVRQRLVDLFDEEKVQHHVNPMEAVALGAAILAQQLQGIACPRHNCQILNPYDATECCACGASLSTARAAGGVDLFEVTERDLGIAVLENGDPDVFAVLIPAGTPYPLDEPRRKRFLTRGHKITIPVYAGDKPQASRNEYLGLVEHELPSNVPARTPVWVQFNYDRNRILSVRVEVEGRPELSYEVTPKRHVPDPSRVRDDKWRTGLQDTIVFAEMVLREYGEFIGAEQKEQLGNDMQSAQGTLRGQDQAAGQRAMNELLQTVGKLDIAGRLLLVDHLMNNVDPRTARWLAEQSKSLRDAYRAQDAGRMARIRKALDTEIRQALAKPPYYERDPNLAKAQELLAEVETPFGKLSSWRPDPSPEQFERTRREIEGELLPDSYAIKPETDDGSYEGRLKAIVQKGEKALADRDEAAWSLANRQLEELRDRIVSTLDYEERRRRRRTGGESQEEPPDPRIIKVKLGMDLIRLREEARRRGRSSELEADFADCEQALRSIDPQASSAMAQLVEYYEGQHQPLDAKVVGHAVQKDEVKRREWVKVLEHGQVLGALSESPPAEQLPVLRKPTVAEVVDMFRALNLPVTDDVRQIEANEHELEPLYLRRKGSPDAQERSKADAWFRNLSQLKSDHPALLAIVYESFTQLADTALEAAISAGTRELTPAFRAQLERLALEECRCDIALARRFFDKYSRQRGLLIGSRCLGGDEDERAKQTVTTLQRFTDVRFPEQCKIHQPVHLSVQLTSESVEIELNVPPDVPRPLPPSEISFEPTMAEVEAHQVELLVFVSAESFEIDKRWRKLTVPFGQDSEKIEFELVGQALGPQIIEVEFYHGAARVGYVVVETQVVEGDTQGQDVQVIYEAVDDQALAGTEEQPTATVISTWQQDKGVEYVVIESNIRLPVDGGSAPVSSGAEAVAGFWQHLSELLKEVVRQPDLPESELDNLWLNIRGLGQELAEQVLSAELQNHSRSWPPGSTILISTNERWIPWEFIHDGDGFWGSKFVLARVPRIPGPRAFLTTDKSVERHASAQLGKVVNVIGGKLRPKRFVKQARKLFASLETSVDVHALERAALTNVLQSIADADLIHFTCQGHTMPRPCLQLADDLSPMRCLTPSNLQNLPPLTDSVIFANACTSALPACFQGQLHNFGWEFYKRGAAAYIGTLGLVPTGCAVTLAERFYDQLLSGHAVGTSLYDAKSQLGQGNPFWLLYSIYGDPFARKVVQLEAVAEALTKKSIAAPMQVSLTKAPGADVPARPRSSPVTHKPTAQQVQKPQASEHLTDDRARRIKLMPTYNYDRSRIRNFLAHRVLDLNDFCFELVNALRQEGKERRQYEYRTLAGAIPAQKSQSLIDAAEVNEELGELVYRLVSYWFRPDFDGSPRVLRNEGLHEDLIIYRRELLEELDDPEKAEKAMVLVKRIAPGYVPPDAPASLVRFEHGVAVLIGVGEHKDTRITPLPATVDDVHAVRDVLLDPSRCAYLKKHVHVATGPGANRKSILESLDWLAEQARQDPQAAAIFYFSGHGWKDETVNPPRYCLIPYDCNWDQPERTMIRDTLLTRRLRAISDNARQLVVILDACHAGGMTKDAAPPPKGFARAAAPTSQLLEHLDTRGGGTVIISSSKEGELSYVHLDHSRSIFTDCLIDALSGQAHSSLPGAIGIMDAFNYLSARVPTTVRTENLKDPRTGKPAEQHPVMDSVKADNFAIALLRGVGSRPAD